MDALFEKAKSIHLFILDVDGVLTNGILYYGSQGAELKGFHIQDGLGIKLLQTAGITVALISGRASEALNKRAKELKIEHLYVGYDNKLPAYEDLKQKLNLEDAQIAYMGDDLPDLPLLSRAGLAITVPKSPNIIQQQVDYVTKNKGGKGAVREACELILKAQGKYESVIQLYLL